MKKNFLRSLAGLLPVLMLLVSLPAAAGASVVSPTEMFYVYDGANVLSESTEATIVYNNDVLYEKCGAQIVFVTVQSTGSMDIGDYAYKLFDQWGIGSAEKNNGVLILMEPSDDNYWYLQGAGIESRLSSGDLAALTHEYLDPYYDVSDFDTGAAKLFEQLYARVANIYGVTASFKAYSGYDEGASVPAARATASPAATKTPVSTGSTGGTAKKSSGFFGTIVRWVFWFMVINFVLGLLKRRSYRRRGLPVAALGFFLLRPWRIFTRNRPAATVTPKVTPTRSTTTFSGARRAGWYAGAGSSIVKNVMRSSSSSHKSSSSSFSSGFTRSGGGGRSFSSGRSSGGFTRSGGGGASRGGGGGRHR